MPDAHDVRWDRAGRKPRPRTRLRLTCRSAGCGHATLVAQPYMTDATWDEKVAAFMTEHPAEVLPCSDRGGESLRWTGKSLSAVREAGTE